MYAGSVCRRVTLLVVLSATAFFAAGCSPKESHPDRSPTTQDVSAGTACSNAVTATFHWTTDTESGFARDDNGRCIAAG